MKHISSNNQLVQLAYGELKSGDAEQLKAQMAEDALLAKEWETISNMTVELGKVQLAPSDTSLKIILEHSYKTEHLQPH
jgi:hypothetical protein